MKKSCNPPGLGGLLKHLVLFPLKEWFKGRFSEKGDVQTSWVVLPVQALLGAVMLPSMCLSVCSACQLPCTGAEGSRQGHANSRKMPKPSTGTKAMSAGSRWRRSGIFCFGSFLTCRWKNFWPETSLNISRMFLASPLNLPKRELLERSPVGQRHLWLTGPRSDKCWFQRLRGV